MSDGAKLRERDEQGRCGSCARFVRVVESIDENGEVRRTGECLLGVWPSPLFATNTCSQYVKRGTFTANAPRRATQTTRTRTTQTTTSSSGGTFTTTTREIEIPEEILEMDKDEFREVLRDVIRDELGVTDVELGNRWQGGEVVLKPGKEGVQEKRVPIEALFRKIIGIRDKLRVLEQKINANTKLTDEEKLQLQQYITQSYGSLTTFNVLFADRKDAFVGQKGDD
jgi:hypothetical protein